MFGYDPKVNAPARALMIGSAQTRNPNIRSFDYSLIRLFDDSVISPCCFLGRRLRGIDL